MFFEKYLAFFDRACLSKNTCRSFANAFSKTCKSFVNVGFERLFFNFNDLFFGFH